MPYGVTADTVMAVVLTAFMALAMLTMLAWEAFFSPLARQTRSLRRRNRIHRKLNKQGRYREAIKLAANGEIPTDMKWK